MIIKLTIPQELEDYLRNVLNVEPTTYFQNEVMKPLLDKVEDKHTTQGVEEAKVEIKKQVTKIRNSVKIEEVTK